MIHQGDLFDLLPTIEADSIDACVTDPPYNLEFMGKSWDTFTGHEDAGFAYWLSGLIDGEGCFTIKAHTRGTHAPQFTLKLRADEEGTLQSIVRATGIGALSREDRDPNPTVRWTVGDKTGCQRLVDLLDKYPLRAKKRLDYDVWREAVCEWSERPRGNRWHGAADNSKMASLRRRLMNGREYTDVGWSGHHYQDWCRLWAGEVFRVIKPGGYLCAFGGSRTYQRLAAGLEDAGFEIRDSLLWIHGQGFPKNYNLGDGKGTALKPAHEPIALAWKPFKGSIRACHEQHGTAALNIDACRVDAPDGVPRYRVGAECDRAVYGDGLNSRDRAGGIDTETGRWPANVVLDEEAAVLLDEQTGELVSGGAPDIRNADKFRHTYGAFKGGDTEDGIGRSVGGASRFYYVAKPSREERDFGTEGLTARQRDESRKEGNPGGDNPRNRGLQPRGNFHPTVKPVALMRWLVRLVTPVDGLVLDPFTGSGTTGMACRYEQRRFVGIEREAEYVAIAERRIAAVAPLFAETSA